MRRSDRRTIVISALLGLAAVAGCSDTASGPTGGTGYARAFVTDDASASAAPPAAPAPAPAPAPSATSDYAGTISGRMSVSVSADGETWYDLGSPAEVSLDAHAAGNGASVTGDVTVPAGTYAYVRLTLSGASATVDAGSQFGPITLTADVDVMIGSGAEVVIEKQVPVFTISAGSDVRTDIVFDLNSELWLDGDAVQAHNASGQDVESSSTAGTKTSPRGDTVQ